MKKFSVIAMALIIAVYAGLLIYVQSSSDFEQPLSAMISSSDYASWDQTMDDLLLYLDSLGLIDESTKQPLSDGIASEAYVVNGAEFYWWDLENLSDDSAEMTAFDEMYSDGMIDLWGMGTYYMAVLPNGPFGLNITYYTGDAAALEEAYTDYCKKEEIDMNAGVWLKTLDDIEAYLIEEGAIDASADRITINWGSEGDPEHLKGYRYNDNLDIYWYDVANLEEGSTYYEQYWSIRETGMEALYNGTIIYYYVNGPFLLHFYVWSNDPLPEDEQERIAEIFLSFEEEYMLE